MLDTLSFTTNTDSFKKIHVGRNSQNYFIMESFWNIGCPLTKYPTPSVMELIELGTSESEATPIYFKDLV